MGQTLTLSNQQKEVVYSQSKRLLCLAGAGTGKTHTMIARILNLVESEHISPSSILCLTFTHAAATEMESRYILNSTNLDKPYFGTFHAFCYKLLCNDEAILNKLGYKSVPDIIDEDEEATLHTKVKMLTSVNLPKYKLKITYKPTFAEKFQWEVFQKKLNQLLRDNNKITFDRLCYGVCELFTRKDVTIMPYIDHYSYVLVDEFQDTDKLQWEFIQSFDKSAIMVVGDIRQAIYGFRGADSSIIKSIAKDSSWNVVKLEQNFRSTIEICQYANEFLNSYKDDVPDVVLTSEKSGFPVVKIPFDAFLADISRFSNTFGSTAVIARTNKEVDSLKLLLMRRELPYECKRSNELEKEITSALNDTFRETYLTSLLSQDIKLEVLRKKYLDPEYDIEHIFKKYVFETYSRIEAIKNSDNFDEINDLVRSNTMSIKEIARVSSLDIVDENNAIYLGTIHSVKGLEFENVYVILGSTYGFDLTKEEHKNLLYVACTRAKSKLIIVES